MSDSAIDDLKQKFTDISPIGEAYLRLVRETARPQYMTLEAHGAHLKNLREMVAKQKAMLAKFGPDYDYGFFERAFEVPEGAGIEAIFKAMDGMLRQESNDFALRIMGGAV